jgi:hypothetical protein
MHLYKIARLQAMGAEYQAEQRLEEYVHKYTTRDEDILFTRTDYTNWLTAFTVGTFLGQGGAGPVEVSSMTGLKVVAAITGVAGLRGGYNSLCEAAKNSERHKAVEAFLGETEPQVTLDTALSNKRGFLGGALRGAAYLTLPLVAGWLFGTYLRYG